MKRREGKGIDPAVRRRWLDASHRAERRYGRALVRAALDGADAPRAEPVRKAAQDAAERSQSNAHQSAAWSRWWRSSSCLSSGSDVPAALLTLAVCGFAAWAGAVADQPRAGR